MRKGRLGTIFTWRYRECHPHKQLDFADWFLGLGAPQFIEQNSSVSHHLEISQYILKKPKFCVMFLLVSATYINGSFSGSTSTSDPFYFTNRSDYSNATDVVTGYFNFPNLGLSFPFTSFSHEPPGSTLVPYLEWTYNGTIWPSSFDPTTNNLRLTEVRGFVTDYDGATASLMMNPLPPPSPYL